jgi:hypothetical protein
MQVSSGPQTLLHSYNGQWQGITRTWFEPEVLVDESEWSATIYPILGERFVQYDYMGSMQDNPLEGKATLGFNAMTGNFEMAWIDSFHQSTGIMYCKGPATAAGISVLGSYLVDELGTSWGWRTDFELTSKNELAVRSYNITPDGVAYLGVETLYTRH